MPTPVNTCAVSVYSAAVRAPEVGVVGVGGESIVAGGGGVSGIPCKSPGHAGGDVAGGERGTPKSGGKSAGGEDGVWRVAWASAGAMLRALSLILLGNPS